jgi:hypothetical protein
MIIRDFYFAAWLIEQGIEHVISNGVVQVNINHLEHNKLKREYNNTVKQYFTRVKKIIRLINASR